MRNYNLKLLSQDIHKIVYSTNFFSWKTFDIVYILPKSSYLKVFYNSNTKNLQVSVWSKNNRKCFDILSGFIRASFDINHAVKHINSSLADLNLANDFRDINIPMDMSDPNVFDNL